MAYFRALFYKNRTSWKNQKQEVHSRACFSGVADIIKPFYMVLGVQNELHPAFEQIIPLIQGTWKFKYRILKRKPFSRFFDIKNRHWYMVRFDDLIDRKDLYVLGNLFRMFEEPSSEWLKFIDLSTIKTEQDFFDWLKFFPEKHWDWTVYFNSNHHSFHAIRAKSFKEMRSGTVKQRRNFSYGWGVYNGGN